MLPIAYESGYARRHLTPQLWQVVPLNLTRIYTSACGNQTTSNLVQSLTSKHWAAKRWSACAMLWVPRLRVTFFSKVYPCPPGFPGIRKAPLPQPGHFMKKTTDTLSEWKVVSISDSVCNLYTTYPAISMLLLYSFIQYIRSSSIFISVKLEYKICVSRCIIRGW